MPRIPCLVPWEKNINWGQWRLHRSTYIHSSNIQWMSTVSQTLRAAVSLPSRTLRWCTQGCFLNVAFLPWLYQGFLSFPGGNRLDRMKSNSLQTWHTHGRPRLAHAASSTAHLPFYAPVAHLWFPPPPPLASTCLGPLCQMNSASSLTFDFRVTFPKSLTWSAAAAAKSLQSCPTLCDPIDGNHQAPPSLGFSRQEHWSGLPFPSPMHESEKWKWSRSVVCLNYTSFIDAYCFTYHVELVIFMYVSIPIDRISLRARTICFHSNAGHSLTHKIDSYMTISEWMTVGINEDHPNENKEAILYLMKQGSHSLSLGIWQRTKDCQGSGKV